MSSFHSIVMRIMTQRVELDLCKQIYAQSAVCSFFFIPFFFLLLSCFYFSFFPFFSNLSECGRAHFSIDEWKSKNDATKGAYEINKPKEE